MLKLRERVKEAEIRAVDAVRDLLSDVPSVEVESVEYERKVGGAYGVDGLIGLSYPGGSCALVVEVKSNGAPRFVRSGVYQLESCVAQLHRSGEANGGRRLIPMLVSLTCLRSRAPSAPTTMSPTSIWSGMRGSRSTPSTSSAPSQTSPAPRPERCAPSLPRRRQPSCASCCASRIEHGRFPIWPRRPMRATAM